MKHQWRFLLNEEDRITQLPVGILEHILSFIDTTQAVKTSILPKRWKLLWRSLHNIRLHLHGKVSYYRVPLCLLIALSLDTEYWVREDLALMEECVLYAINHGVQSLRLHVPRCLNLRLPAMLSTSTTRRELEIRQKNTWIDVPARFSLPNLKTLYLDANLSFNYDDWREPFAGLPELEKLSLRLWNGLVLKAPPKLRVLEIFGTSSIFRIEEISTPLLTSFRYKGYSPLECSKMNPPMLEEVNLDIYGIMYKNLKLFDLNCVELLHQLGNATIVSLTLNSLKVLELDGGPMEQTPPFPNLKYLKVRKGLYSDRTVLQSVMNYLTIGTLYFESSLKVEIPHDVAVVQQLRKSI